MLTLLCLLYFTVSTVITDDLDTVETDDLDIVEVYKTIGIKSPEKGAEVLKQYGAKRLGMMLQKTVVRDCDFSEGIGMDQPFNIEELLQEALQTSSVVSVHDHSLVCLNQGKYKDTHSSASVYVQYSVKGNVSKVSTHLPILCNEGEWIAGYIKPSHSNTTSLKTTARDDCQMCPHSNMLPASSTSSCLGM